MFVDIINFEIYATPYWIISKQMYKLFFLSEKIVSIIQKLCKQKSLPF